MNHTKTVDDLRIQTATSRGDAMPLWIATAMTLAAIMLAGSANAALVKGGTAQVLTKGTVSLALAGAGEGVDLGISFGKFTISRAK